MPVKAIPIKKQIVEDYGDGFVDKHTEIRYVIVDADTGEVLDDAQGYGYKSAQKAHAAWSYKQKPKKQRAAEANQKKRIKKWLEKHSDIEDSIAQMYLYAYKDNIEVQKSDIGELLKDEGVLDALPVSLDVFWKYIRK